MNYVASIKLKDERVVPKFFRARTVPYAKEVIEKEIDRLTAVGILSPVDFSE